MPEREEMLTPRPTAFGAYIVPQTKEAFLAGKPTAESLVASTSIDEIAAKLQKIFGTYEDLERMDTGEIPYTIEGDVSIDYMADIEHAAIERDLVETRILLGRAYDEIYAMYKEGAAREKALSPTSTIREGGLLDKYRASIRAQRLQPPKEPREMARPPVPVAVPGIPRIKTEEVVFGGSAFTRYTNLDTGETRIEQIY